MPNYDTDLTVHTALVIPKRTLIRARGLCQRGVLGMCSQMSYDEFRTTYGDDMTPADAYRLWTLIRTWFYFDLDIYGISLLVTKET